MPRRLIPIALLLALASCSASSDNNSGLDGGAADTGVERGLLADGSSDDAGSITAEGCNPLSPDPAYCLLPWPSSRYLAEDKGTVTGWRVAYPRVAMPENSGGERVDPTPWNRLDGFSPGSQPVVAFAGGVSSEGLPGHDDIASSITDESLVWIIELDTGVRVPLFAEVDANAEPDQAAMIVRPMRPLRFDTAHAVVLRQGLKNGAGKLLARPAAFAAITAGEAPAGDAALTAEAARLAPALQKLRDHGVDLAEVLLAWDFYTASEQAVTGPLIGMVDEALERLGDKGPVVEQLEVEDLDASQSTELMRRVSGKLVAPSFLASDDADALLSRDADGKPRYRGEQRFEFHLQVPRCAEQATGPLPVLIFGHGLFGDPKEMLDSGLHRGLAQRLCMVEIAARWLGLSLRDVPSAASVAQDFSRLPRITDHLLQAHVNAQVLVKLAQRVLPGLPAMQLKKEGKPITDGAAIHYLGISLGGIQGATFAALNKDIERFALHVPGGYWSLMLERSSNFASLALVLSGAYPRPTDRLLLAALSQSLWDSADPLNFAQYVRRSPLPGRAAKRVAYTESRHDDQVNNLATRVIVRALGLPLMTPKVESVYGVEERAGPLDAAYVQWDVEPAAVPPGTNVPAERLLGAESAHFAVRALESFKKQLERFLRPDGKVEHTCDGPCGRE